MSYDCLLSCTNSLAFSASNWSSVSAHSYQPELVHDITGSDEEEYYEDEDDSNGE